MQNRYYVVFKAKIGEQVQEGSRILALDAPIAFDSDIKAVTDHLAAELGAEGVMLMNWQPLVGEQRPALGQPAPSTQEQAKQVAAHLLDQAKAGATKAATKSPKKAAAKAPGKVPAKAPAKATPKAAKPSRRTA